LSYPLRTTIKRLLSVKGSVVEIEARFLPQEVKDALDDFCDPPGLVVSWPGKQLHDGGIYPFAVGGSGDSAHPSTCFWQAACPLRPYASDCVYETNS
jgi:hypothetical protein